MESTAWRCGSGPAMRWRWFAFALVTMMLLGLATPAVTLAQDDTDAAQTPDVVIPGTGDAEESATDATPDAPVEETSTEPAAEPAADPAATPGAESPPTSSTTSNGVRVSATDAGHPAVVAHGLAFLSGEQSVWQVREISPESGTEAEISSAAFVYQVEGTSIIRNDVTGKRALLDPGEALFKAGGDAYTTFSDSDDSLIWVFEVVGPSDVASDAVYESPLIDDYREGVFDMLMIRYVLDPGETATLPDRTGPALVVSASGDIDVNSGGIGLLGTGDGQLITEDATVANNSDSPAVFLMSAFGSEVGDATSSTGTASTDAAEEPTAEPAPDPATEAEEEPAADEPVVDEPEVTQPEVTDPPVTDDGGAGASGTETSINITAQAELYVVVVADGITVFDGPIPVGGQSGVIVGTTFEVYTTFGTGTLFTDACGSEFMMGFEEGEANYVLESTPESCAP